MMINYILVLSFMLVSNLSYAMNILRASKTKLIEPIVINRQLERLRNSWNQLDRQRMRMFWRGEERSKSMSRLLKKQQRMGKNYQWVALKPKKN